MGAAAAAAAASAGTEEQEKEAEEFEAWQPTPKELEAEWKELMKQVPKEDLPEVQKDWKKAGGAEKKQMLWDVRKLLLQNEASLL